MKNIALSLSLLFCSLAAYSQWSEQTSSIPYTIFSLSAVNDNIVWASASGANILRTTNGGQVWENVGVNVPPPMGVEPCIFALDANTAIFSCYAGYPVRVAYVYKTTNAGQSWTLVFTQGSDAYVSGIWFKNATTGFMVGWPVGGRWSLWKTTNTGDNWDSTGLYIPETNLDVWSFENSVFYLGNSIWFGARGKGIYFSSNNGSNWTLQDLTSAGFPYPSAIWFDSPTNGFSSADRNIIKTTNAGTNWNILQGTFGSEIIRGISGSGSEWWYVRFLSNQIFYFSNSGQNWAAQYTAPTNAGYNHIIRGRNGGTVMWAARIDGGISVYTPPEAVNYSNSNVPVEFKLYQNYPNPFNPSTKIRFSLPPYKGGKGDVSLKIFDILGHEVPTLLNQQLKPGSYEFEWNSSNFPSGVYFCRLQSGDLIKVKKMLMIK